MSNNAPDYENDLVFPPKSADVHTTTIEKCDRLEIADKAKVIFKLLAYFILCFLIVLLIEHSSQNWSREFMKQCCSCEIKGEKL